MPMNESEGSVHKIIINSDGLYEGDLRHYFKVVFSKAKNLFNPYHNFRHMMHVLWLSHRAATYYKKSLTKRQMRNLFIAAMMHDFDHPRLLGNDKKNIAIALKGLKKWIAPIDEAYYDDIAEIIRCTEYPYKVLTKKLSLEMQIIRDSDISQLFFPVWIQQIVFGLAEEVGIPPKTMLENQEKFINSIEFNTGWAKKLFGPMKKRKIREVRTLLELLV